MNPRICTTKNDPPRAYGDCVRACIATLLDRDDVPHFFDGRSAEDAWFETRAWLATIGKTIYLFGTTEHVELMTMNNLGLPYMLLHGTHRGDHAIICENGKMIHDPAWYRSEMTGPLSAGHYVIGVIGDLVL